MSMQVKGFCFNIKKENTYVVYDQSGECVIIDCGCQTEVEQNELAQFIVSNSLKPKRLICTHFHLDHVFGNSFIEQTYGLKAETSEAERPLSEMMHYQLVAFEIADEDGLIPTPLFSLREGETVEFGNSSLSIISTPGHSPGGLAFYSAKDGILFSGDTLMRGEFGATNLPGGRLPKLVKSIEEKLFPLPDNTVVYAGHGEPTTIGAEKASNPILAEIEKCKAKLGR